MDKPTHLPCSTCSRLSVRDDFISPYTGKSLRRCHTCRIIRKTQREQKKHLNELNIPFIISKGV